MENLKPENHPPRPDHPLTRRSLQFTLAAMGIVVLVGIVFPYISHPSEQDQLLYSIIPSAIIALLSLSSIITGSIGLFKTRWERAALTSAIKTMAGMALCCLLAMVTSGHVYNFIFHYKPAQGYRRQIAAMAALKNIRAAEESFKMRKGRFGTLEELANDGLIDMGYASGKPVNKYIYSVTDLSENTFCIHADRADHRTAFRDFNISEDGVIHYLESQTKGTVPRGAGTPIPEIREDESPQPAKGR